MASDKHEFTASRGAECRHWILARCHEHCAHGEVCGQPRSAACHIQPTATEFAAAPGVRRTRAPITRERVEELRDAYRAPVVCSEKAARELVAICDLALQALSPAAPPALADEDARLIAEANGTHVYEGSDAGRERKISSLIALCRSLATRLEAVLAALDAKAAEIEHLICQRNDLCSVLSARNAEIRRLTAERDEARSEAHKWSQESLRVVGEERAKADSLRRELAEARKARTDMEKLLLSALRSSIDAASGAAKEGT